MGKFRGLSRKGTRDTGFLYRHYTGRSRPSVVCRPGLIDCPDREGKVHFVECLECDKFRVWHEKDGDFRQCWHEYEDLRSRGHYDGTWDDHPENFDPDTFARIQENKRLNREVNRELESERFELREEAGESAGELEELEGHEDADEEIQEEDEDEEEDYY